LCVLGCWRESGPSKWQRWRFQ